MKKGGAISPHFSPLVPHFYPNHSTLGIGNRFT